VGITWFRRAEAKIHRRPRGPVVLAQAAVLVLCVIGLTGCPGPSSSSAAGPPLSSVLGGSPTSTSTQGCFTTAYVRRDRGSPAGGQAVLAAAQFPSWDVPDPDVNIDTTRQEDEDQQTWANDGIDNARSVAVPSTALAPSKANLLKEANGVVATEDTTLLTDDVNNLATDPDYGDQICQALGLLDNAIQAFTVDPNNLPQVVHFLKGLTTSANPSAPDDLAGAFSDAVLKFEGTFPGCGGILDTTEWLISQLESLFCPNS
jgi:hypothetical protein